MSKVKRTFNIRLISKLNSYSVEDVVTIYDIHENTVLSWLKHGLNKIDNKKPYLVHGSDLISFISNRQKKRKKPCKPNELYCLKCGLAKRPLSQSIIFDQKSENSLMISGRCSTCDTKMFKSGSSTKLKEYMSVFGIEECHSEHIADHDNSLSKSQLKGFIR